MAEPLRVGLAGLGTVGSAVAAMLMRSRAALADRVGRSIELVAYASKDPPKDATLDLSTFGTPAGLRQIHASVGSGQLTVRLPAALPVTVHAHAGAGRLKVVGQVTDGLSAERDLSSGGPTVNRLDLDLRVGIGQVTVTRVSP